MANITRKQLVNALIANADVNKLAEWLVTDDIAPVADALAKLEQATNRQRISKPSAETLRNRQIATELAEEINARNAEFTAADIAEFYTDPDGLTLSPRKVGALLKNAVSMGLIAVSPEPWSVKHYAPVGFEFAKKPVRVVRSTKAKDAEKADNAE